jgi:hypothetical protein
MIKELGQRPTAFALIALSACKGSDIKWNQFEQTLVGCEPALRSKGKRRVIMKICSINSQRLMTLDLGTG